MGKVPIRQQRSATSEAHLQLAPVGNILLWATADFSIAEPSVEKFAGTMLWWCSDFTSQTQDRFPISSPVATKREQMVIYFLAC